MRVQRQPSSTDCRQLRRSKAGKGENGRSIRRARLPYGLDSGVEERALRARNCRPIGHMMAWEGRATAMANLAECRTKAAEFESRAARATDWQLRATFKDLARFYRQLGKYLEETGADQSEPPRSN